MLLRKGATVQYVLATALLVAVLTSASSVANYVAYQVETVGRLAGMGETYLILNRSAVGVTDSVLGAEVVELLRSLPEVEYVLPQRLLTATIITGSTNRLVIVRGVEDVEYFLKIRGVYVGGTVVKDCGGVYVGEILATILSVEVGDKVTLTAEEVSVGVRIVGVVRSQTQSDAEIVVPMEIADRLVGGGGRVSIVEFTLKRGVRTGKVLDHIARILPESARVIRVQQLVESLRDVNEQILSFLSAWSLVVYATVAISSYVTASRLITESAYELAMLRAIGARRRQVFALVLAYTLAVVSSGSTLGVALGVVGAQTASALLRWIGVSAEMAPFLEVEQAAWILLLVLASSILGCLHPAVESTRTRYAEKPL